MMSYQLIFFDLDDTLIDFTSAELIGLQKIHAEFYQSITYSVFENHYRTINSALWQQVGQKNGLMPSELHLLRFNKLHQQMDCQFSAQDIADSYLNHLGEHCHWFPKVQKAIEFLHAKGYILGVITNGLATSQNNKKQSLQLNRWFDCFIISDEIGMAKPNQEIFAAAVQSIHQKHNRHFSKQSMLMVGDSLTSDGHGAMNFGIDYCHISSKTLPTESNITHHLNSVALLPAYLGHDTEYEFFLKTSIDS